MGRKLKKILQDSNGSKQDPLGSYTGKPENPNEAPSQDADDI
jgi:hypothetical protein